MVSIKDVAREAGVSNSTVSNYLNQVRLRPETAERVRRAIEKLKYTQNLAARSLVKGHSRILGLIVSEISNEFFTNITDHFLDQALIMDFETVVMNTNYDPNRTLNCIRRLIGLQVPAVAVMTSEILPDATREMLAQKKICSAYLDLDCPGPFMSSILVDYGVGMREALEHLKSLGHERIGMISGPTALPSVMRRIDSFVEVVPDGRRMIYHSDGSFQGGYYCCSRMLSINAPSAILCTNDRMAIGALHCAHDRGLDVPRDLSIVGFDKTSVSEFTEPPLSTVDINRNEIVHHALDAIIQMLESDSHMGSRFRVNTEFVSRESTGPAAIASN